MVCREETLREAMEQVIISFLSNAMYIYYNYYSFPLTPLYVPLNKIGIVLITLFFFIVTTFIILTTSMCFY